MFCPHVFVVINSSCCFFKKDKNTKMNFFCIKEFEIGYVLMFSSVKISTYRYHNTNKTLSFIYHRLHAHRISPPQNEFLIIEIKPRHCIALKKALEKNNITLYNCYC